MAFLKTGFTQEATPLLRGRNTHALRSHRARGGGRRRRNRRRNRRNTPQMERDGEDWLLDAHLFTVSVVAACRTTIRSWRTLPGQRAAASSSIASGEQVRLG